MFVNGYCCVWFGLVVWICVRLGGGFTALVSAFYLLFGLFGGFCYSSSGVCYFCGLLGVRGGRWCLWLLVYVLLMGWGCLRGWSGSGRCFGLEVLAIFGFVGVYGYGLVVCWWFGVGCFAVGFVLACLV